MYRICTYTWLRFMVNAGTSSLHEHLGLIYSQPPKSSFSHPKKTSAQFRIQRAISSSRSILAIPVDHEIQLPPPLLSIPTFSLWLSLEVKGNSTPKLRNVTEKKWWDWKTILSCWNGPVLKGHSFVSGGCVLEKAYETPNDITPWN